MDQNEKGPVATGPEDAHSQSIGTDPAEQDADAINLLLAEAADDFGPPFDAIEPGDQVDPIDLADYPIHPAANIMPLMSDEEYQGLKQDIAEHGQQDAIALLDGKILDGRNRDKVCRELGIEPRYVRIACDDPLGYVLSKNLHRRQLSPSQRAQVAADLAKMKHGGDRRSEEIKSQTCDLIADAAKALSVSERSVSTAKHVADKGDKAVVDAVKAGEITVNAAKKFVDSVPNKRRQAKIVKRGRKAVAAATKAAAASDPDDNGLIAEFITALNTGKIKATKEQQAAFADRDESEQHAGLASILAGRQTLRDFLDNGLAPPTIDDKIKEERSKTEHDARDIGKRFDEFTAFAMEVIEAHRANNPWEKDHDRYRLERGYLDSASKNIKDLLDVLRRSKPNHACRKCNGIGCNKCFNSGMLTTYAREHDADLILDPK